MNKQQMKELSSLTQEAYTLSEKVRQTPQEKRRFAFLTGTAIPAIRSGATLAEVNEFELNETEQRNGLPLSRLTVNPEQRQREQEYRFWIGGLEKRTANEVEGAPMLTHIGSYTGLGFFVPTGFFDKVWDTMKASDALFDDEAVTLIKTDNGRPLPIPTMDDTNNDASVLGEASAKSSVNIGAIGQAKLGAYSYATREWIVPLEAFEDMNSTLTSTKIFQRFTSRALARGIGRDLVIGGGTTQPLGLIPSLEAAGAPVVTVIGSAKNTGGSEDGTSSIGSADFSTALSTLDSAYVDSPSIAWLMNRSTLNTVAGIVTKQGNRLNLVQYDADGKPSILGIPVKICPSMDNIGVSNIPVVLGDLSYWATRIVTPGAEEGLGIKTFREADGLIEKGLVAFRSFVRADGALLWNAGPSPFVVMRNHS
jgi:HK97 family phage major capsid protein